MENSKLAKVTFKNERVILKSGKLKLIEKRFSIKKIKNKNDKNIKKINFKNPINILVKKEKKEYINIEEASKRSKISYDKIENLCEEGKVDSSKINNEWVIYWNSLKKYIKNNTSIAMK